MKKICSAIVFCMAITSMFAQDSTIQGRRRISNLAGRPSDHLLLQLGVTNWAGRSDSIHTKGLSRSFNIYFLFDFPFKSNPHLSVAFGPGVATDNVYLDKMSVGIKETTSSIEFHDVSDTNHFKKYKLATAYLEAPLELRFSAHPETPNKSFKIALGVKAGILVNAHTKGRILENSAGNALSTYTEKESSRKFFNTNRFVATARVGYGVLSLFGTYQLNPLFKEGLGPDLRPFTIGLTLSGL
jgi:hypothetical protein